VTSLWRSFFKATRRPLAWPGPSPARVLTASSFARTTPPFVLGASAVPLSHVSMRTTWQPSRLPAVSTGLPNTNRETPRGRGEPESLSRLSVVLRSILSARWRTDGAVRKTAQPPTPPSMRASWRSNLDHQPTLVRLDQIRLRGHQEQSRFRRPCTQPAVLSASSLRLSSRQRRARQSPPCVTVISLRRLRLPLTGRQPGSRVFPPWREARHRLVTTASHARAQTIFEGVDGLFGLSYR